MATRNFMRTISYYTIHCTSLLAEWQSPQNYGNKCGVVMVCHTRVLCFSTILVISPFMSTSASIRAPIPASSHLVSGFATVSSLLNKHYEAGTSARNALHITVHVQHASWKCKCHITTENCTTIRSSRMRSRQ